MDSYMLLNKEGIKDINKWQQAGIKLPDFDVEKIAEQTKKYPTWVHFGAGNIFLEDLLHS
ncbi:MULTISPECIES: hypothetical protein [Thermoanaerobacter]|uniref:Uncharacterized protein n=2 Tax=Thermoanaerobacter TaxID=1754 RepID=B0K7B6_THEP3|nr:MULTISPECIES: hypothetical protein [Thermoanaerobacter]ABY92381.1 hypothetical protein Teth514_1082 [Thermoanaerobacter sp. X514]ABY94263.1 hypothetical protein Teth39_0599 [Thermoanaerobacter pseudethanolicus ATCC 33223]HAA81334.1 hypothetical protein [Thermoanaerobacter sp.]HBW60527.1 hypothetical protein [Thermoanaerobacter sp.]HCD09916.1 hypothetical protein [Thermoanaerobacter sp.]